MAKRSFWKFDAVLPCTVPTLAIFETEDGNEIYCQVLAWAVCHAELPKIDDTDPDMETTDVVGLITAGDEARLIRVDDDGYQGRFVRYDVLTPKEYANL